MASFAHDSRQLAEAYERASDLQLATGKRLVERLDVEEGAHVLDVGCGTGRLARWIGARVGPKGIVVGVDPLTERIALARSSTGEGAVRFEVGRAEDLRAFDDASFDVVCMSSVLHWVSDKAKALAEARRLLRPGGRLGVTTPPHELAGQGTVGRVLHPLLREPPYVDHVDRSALGSGDRCTSTDLVRLILASGLALVELHVSEEASRHADGEEFVAFAEASSFGNVLRVVPEPLRSSFRADLVAAFDREAGADGLVVRGWVARLVARRAP